MISFSHQILLGFHCDVQFCVKAVTKDVQQSQSS